MYPQTSTSQKQPSHDPSVEPPFKRRCTELTVGYLNLYNNEVREASTHRGNYHKDGDEDGMMGYRVSQLGLTVWTPFEKDILYEAISRLGRTAVMDISALIGSKSVVEVEDYLNHLQYASEERVNRFRPILQPAEIPAAIELSPQCCHALDEAADTLSILQEQKDQKREEQKWGSSWLLTPSMFEPVSEEEEEEALCERASDLEELFDIPKWLELSSYIFMNSSIPSDNWTFFDEDPPSIWATTMEDFRSLAVSVTRRLVQTTLFIAASRIRTRRESEPRVLDIVRREDVEAALQGLNMEDKRFEFWRRCARRLRLNVQDNESQAPRDERKDGMDGRDYMTFDEVEALLGHDDTEHNDRINKHESTGSKAPGDVETPTEEGLKEDGLTDHEAEIESLVASDSSTQLTAEELAVRNEAEEIILFSGVDFPQSTRSKEALLNRISSERQQALYADRCDDLASREEEVKMWELLEKPVPQVYRAKEAPEQLPRSSLGVDGVYSFGKNWRRALQYNAEWERHAM